MGVDNAETVACHMYRVALMAMVLRDNGLDVARCVQMALVHDLAEAIVGDITPRCGVSRERKRQLETVPRGAACLFSPLAIGSDGADHGNAGWHYGGGAC